MFWSRVTVSCLRWVKWLVMAKKWPPVHKAATCMDDCMPDQLAVSQSFSAI